MLKCMNIFMFSGMLPENKFSMMLILAVNGQVYLLNSTSTEQFNLACWDGCCYSGKGGISL